MAAKTKYMLIYEWLSEQIANGHYRPGEKIPNESELAARFGVHRMTVRQAIDRLVGDHLLVRKRGQGTFLLSVQPPILTRDLESITSYHGDIVKGGLVPRYQTLEAAIVPAEGKVAEALGLSPGTEVVYVYRLMLASDIPLVLEKSYLPAELFSGLLGRSLDTILYKIIIEEYGMGLNYARNEIGAILPDEKERKLFKITTACPCLWVEGVVFNDAGRAVEFSRALCRGDKYRFKCSIGKYVCDAVFDPVPEVAAS